MRGGRGARGQVSGAAGPGGAPRAGQWPRGALGAGWGGGVRGGGGRREAGSGAWGAEPGLGRGRAGGGAWELRGRPLRPERDRARGGRTDAAPREPLSNSELFPRQLPSDAAAWLCLED